MFGRKKSYTHHFTTNSSNVVNAIKKAWRINIHPFEEFQHACVMSERICGVNASVFSKTDRFVMSDSIANVVYVIQFMKNIVVIILFSGRRTWLIWKDF